MKDKEQSEQIINNQYRDFNDFDENFNQQFINENFDQEIDNNIISSECTSSEIDSSSIKSDSAASLNKISRACILFDYF
ncbi:unnamed protein product [Rhizophagus irregularis]|nr:unnamed protein product [Rhizophagus irregularis]